MRVEKRGLTPSTTAETGGLSWRRIRPTSAIKTAKFPVRLRSRVSCSGIMDRAIDQAYSDLKTSCGGGSCTGRRSAPPEPPSFAGLISCWDSTVTERGPLRERGHSP